MQARVPVVFVLCRPFSCPLRTCRAPLNFSTDTIDIDTLIDKSAFSMIQLIECDHIVEGEN